MLGRSIFFIFIGCLCYVPAKDELHLALMIVILVIAFFMLFWAILSICQGQPTGVPPALGARGQTAHNGQTTTTTTTRTTTRR